MAVKLRRKYQERVQKDINESRPQGTQLDAFRDSNAQSLAMDVAFFLLPGKIADDEPFRTNLPLLLADISQRFGWNYPIELYFDKLLQLLSSDQDMKDLATLQRKTLQLLKGVQHTIRSDLEKQF